MGGFDTESLTSRLNEYQLIKVSFQIHQFSHIKFSKRVPSLYSLCYNPVMIALGTENKRKSQTVRDVFSSFLNKEVVIQTFPADSGVGKTPWDEETFRGARNRALAARKIYPEAEFSVGLESGLIERYGHIYEEAWACVITTSGQEFFGYSSGLKVPDFITEKMKKMKFEHYEVMNLLDREAKRINNDDTWGTYSDKLIIRDVSLTEALRNALIQIFAPQSSYYHPDYGKKTNQTS